MGLDHVALSLSRYVVIEQTTTATITVDSGATAPPTGSVNITVDNRVVATAPLVDGVATFQLPKQRLGSTPFGRSISGMT